MRTVIVIVTVALLGPAALFGITGAVRAAAALQDESAFVFRRICNIQPGQNAAARALARDMVDLVQRNYPGAEMSVQTGRWITGAQNIERPVDQILFSERHPDAEMRQDFTEILMGDDEFRALQQEIATVVDFISCTETQFRERP